MWRDRGTEDLCSRHHVNAGVSFKLLCSLASSLSVLDNYIWAGTEMESMKSTVLCGRREGLSRQSLLAIALLMSCIELMVSSWAVKFNSASSISSLPSWFPYRWMEDPLQLSLCMTNVLYSWQTHSKILFIHFFFCVCFHPSLMSSSYLSHSWLLLHRGYIFRVPEQTIQMGYRYENSSIIKCKLHHIQWNSSTFAYSQKLILFVPGFDEKDFTA